MHRIDAAGYAAGNLFTDGNPSTGTPATVVDAAWLNAIQEGIAKVIEGAGITLSKGDDNQLKTAIQQLIINGGAIKTPVRAATTANIASLAGGAPSTLDGVALAANDRVLVKDQTTGSQNGIYVVTTLGTGANGTWTRAGDADGSGELVAGMLVVVAEGTTQADQVWELSTDGAITLGATALTFTKQGGLSQAQADARYCGIGYMLVQHQVAQNTSGGSASAGIQTRPLNTVVANTISGASLSSNQITLPAGTYRVRGFAEAFNVNASKIALYNVTDAAYIQQGGSVNGENSLSDLMTSEVSLFGRFTLAATKVLELRQFCEVAYATSGLGYPSNSMGVEVYAGLEIMKES